MRNKKNVLVCICNERHQRSDLSPTLASILSSPNIRKSCQLPLQIRALKQEVADMMKNDQTSNARIRVEEVIRQEYLLEAYSILETYLLLLNTRSSFLKKTKEPPPDMLEAICSVIFAASRVKHELDEMPAIADILMSKFRNPLCVVYQNKDFPQAVIEEHRAPEFQVNQDIIAFLSVTPAPPDEKISKLEQISLEFDAPFDKDKAFLDMMPKSRVVPRYPAATETKTAAAVGPSPPRPQTTIAQEKSGTPLVLPAVPTPAPAPTPTTKVAGDVVVESSSNIQKIQPLPPYQPAVTTATTHGHASSQHDTQERDDGNERDPWAPLPPPKLNYGYSFDRKLDNVADWIHRGGSGNSPQDAAASKTARPVVVVAANERHVAESDVGTDGGSGGGGGDQHENGGMARGDGEDNLAKRLAALKGI